MNRKNFVWLARLVVLAGVFGACRAVNEGSGGADQGGGKAPVRQGVAVKPAVVVLRKGAVEAFTAKITGGGGGALSWAVSGGTAGSSIDGGTGVLTVDQNETAKKLTVRAELASNPAKFGTAVVVVTGNESLPLEGGISVTPGVVTVARGGSQNFTAVLSAGGGDPGSVTWTVDGKAGSTISAAGGTLAVDPAEDAEKLIVTASAGKKLGTAVVYVAGNGGSPPALAGPVPENAGVSVSPVLLTLEKGGSQTFTAGGSENLSWTLPGNTASAIAGGVLSVSGDETAESIVVKASDAANPALYGTAIVTVRGNEGEPALVKEGLSLDPGDVTVARGGQQSFSARDGGGAVVSGALDWRVLGGRAGTSISGGLLNVAKDETAKYLKVRAEKAESQGASYGTAVVEVTAPKIRIRAASEDVVKGGANQFTAIGVADAGWDLEGAHHGNTTIDKNGLLNVAAGEAEKTLTVRATAADWTAGTAQVNVTEPVAMEKRTTLTLSALSLKSNTWKNGAAYGGGVFLIGGDDGKIFRSTDPAKKWEEVIKMDALVRDIAYGGGIFVAGVYQKKGAYSEDYGLTWNAIEDSDFNGVNIWRIRCLNGKFFAVGYGRKIAYSEDGKEWASFTAIGSGSDLIRDIAYGEGKFITVGGTMIWSADGISNWQAVSGISVSIYESIVYGDGKFAASLEGLWYSDDGSSGWVKSSAYAYDELEYGGGKFVSINKTGIAYSDDGVRWTAVNGYGGYGVIYGNGRFVVADHGKVHVIGQPGVAGQPHRE
jgi:hypothetical protein